jgi:hypothetical protein
LASSTPCWSKKLSAARYCVFADPPEKARFWFCAGAVRSTSSNQLVLAVPSSGAAVGLRPNAESRAVRPVRKRAVASVMKLR